MIIRDANMNDLENLFPIFMEGYLYHYEKRKDVFLEPNELILRDVLIENLGSTDEKILISLIDNKIIGYIRYNIKEKNQNKILWVDEFVIKESERHKGYGKTLLERIEAIAKEKRIKRVELSCWAFNEDALNMYKKCGFNTQRIVLEHNI